MRDEPALGRYLAPSLLFHVEFQKLLLDPVARYAIGCDEVIDLYRLPGYADSARVLRRNGRWEYLATVTPSRLDPGFVPDEVNGDVALVPGRFTEGEYDTLVKWFA